MAQNSLFEKSFFSEVFTATYLILWIELSGEWGFDNAIRNLLIKLFPKWELEVVFMRIIARSTLRVYWQAHKDAEQPLKAWLAEAKKATWKTPNEIKKSYTTASIFGQSRVVFNIGGNKYRLLVSINYRVKIAYIKFIGTHKEYDKIDPESYRSASSS